MFDHWFVRKWLAPLMVATAFAILVLTVLISPDTKVAAVDDVIEQVSPAPGDEVLSQSEISIDLADGYDAELTLNGVAIPEAELRRTGGLNVVAFRPDQGKVVESLRPEVNCVNALYWPVATGRSTARSYQWCFTAS